METEQTLLAPLVEAETPALQLAAQALARRVCQARHSLNLLNADDFWHDAEECDTRSLPLILGQFSYTGDHAGHMRKMRFDFQMGQGKRMKYLKGMQRRSMEYRLAGRIVDRVDCLVQLAQNAVRT